MKEFELKYGCNPNQKPAKIFMEDGSDLPIEILCGRPGYINFLDAFNSWQLVSEIKAATGFAAAASFKHVSPTSAAIGRVLPLRLKRACFVDDIEDLDSSPIACAYARARGTDRMSSFGDFIALSDTCDEVTAKIICREVSDGIIAPAYTDKALEMLRGKRNGTYAVIKINPDYVPQEIEKKQVFGVTFWQKRNDYKVTDDTFSTVVTKNKTLNEEAKLDMTVALITLKYTQSNSVCFCYDGQAIGVGAGQQSRIHCTRLAASKADLWFLRQSEKVLNLKFSKLSRAEKNNVIDLYLSQDACDVLAEGNWQKYFSEKPQAFTENEKREYLSKISGVTLGSDAFFPFGDNIERGKKSGVSFVVQPGGSVRDDDVIAVCDKYDIVMVTTNLRLFHH